MIAIDILTVLILVVCFPLAAWTSTVSAYKRTGRFEHLFPALLITAAGIFILVLYLEKYLLTLLFNGV